MRKILLSTITVVMAFVSTNSTFGLSAEQRRVYEGGARYVNTERGCETSDSFNPSSNLYFIGDSLTVGMDAENLAEDRLSSRLTTAGWNPSVTGQNCRPLYNAANPDGDDSSCGGNTGLITSAFNNLTTDSAYIRSAGRVVVALGTNALDGGSDAFREKIGEYIQELLSLNPSLSAGDVYWVNFIADGGSVAPIMEERSTILDEEAATIGFNVIDWRNQVLSNPELYPFSDNVHHTNEGYRSRAAFIVEQIGRPSASPAGFGGSAPSGINWPADLDSRWIELWEQMGREYQVDAKILAAIFTSEHGGNFTSYDGDGGSASNGGWAQPGSSTATGPFQFLNDAWDDMVRKEPLLPPRTDRGPSDPRNNQVHASRAAAVYIRFLGAPEGLLPGSIDQNFQRASYDDFIANDENTRSAEVPWTVASIAVRYNQGAWWRPGTVQGNNRPNDYMQDSIDTYLLLGGQTAVLGFGSSGSGGCGTGTPDTASATILTIDGEQYAFPIDATNATLGRGWTWPCPDGAFCHHDSTAAFDLYLTGPAEDSIGVPVFAITGGEITGINSSLRGEDGCYSFHLVDNVGWDYWYAHIVAEPNIENGVRVQAGEQIGTIGPVRCTRNSEGGTSIPHLHIDRGSPMGRGGGSDCCRDAGIIPIINQLYENLP